MVKLTYKRKKELHLTASYLSKNYSFTEKNGYACEVENHDAMVLLNENPNMFEAGEGVADIDREVEFINLEDEDQQAEADDSPTPVDDIQPSEDANDEDDDHGKHMMLLGPSLPDYVRIADGAMVMLGEIVRYAYEESGLSIEDWNNLDNDEMTTKCLDIAGELNSADVNEHAINAPAPAPEPEDDPNAIDTLAEKVAVVNAMRAHDALDTYAEGIGMDAFEDGTKVGAKKAAIIKHLEDQQAEADAEGAQ